MEKENKTVHSLWCQHTFAANSTEVTREWKASLNFGVEPTEGRISGDSLSEQAKKDSVCLLAKLSKLIFRLMSIPFWVQTTCIRTF